MTSSRERILGRIKTGTAAFKRTPADVEKLEARLRSPQPGIVPAFTKVEGKERIELFIAKAEAQDNTVVRVTSAEAALGEVKDFLRQYNLPARVVRAPSSALDDLRLDEAPDLEVRQGAAIESDVTSVTPVLCAVAETGTLVTLSGADTPSTLNFVPENHIAIVREKDMLSSYEDSWEKVRSGDLPRTVNWISGPSRSGDIAMTMYMGAHGPRRQHIILIEDE